MLNDALHLMDVRSLMSCLPSSKTHSVHKGAAVHVLLGHSYCIASVAWSPDGGMLAACSRFGDDGVSVCEAATGAVKHTLAGGHAQVFNSVAWSPDGRHLAIGDFNGERLSVWEVATGTSVRVVPNKGAYVTSVAWSPCGSLLFASAGKAVQSVYNMQNGWLY